MVDLLSLVSEGAEFNKEDYVPVVLSNENPVLVGSIKLGSAIDYLSVEIESLEKKLKGGRTNDDYRIQKFFDSLRLEQGTVREAANE